ncbi:MAG: ABC transporter permease [Sulfolobales archaeon]
MGIHRRSRLSPIVAVVEAEVKEFILRDMVSILAVVGLTYLFIALIALAGLAIGRDPSGFRSITGYSDPLSYQSIGASIVVISMIIISSMGQYINSASISGRLESLLAAPVRISTVVIATSIPMIIFGLITFTLSSLPIVYKAISSYGLHVVLIATAILGLGMIPIFVLGLLISLAIAKIGSPIALNLAQAVIFTFSGSLYPVTILPEILGFFSKSLPIIYIADSLRSLLITGNPDLGGIPTLLLITIAYGSIGGFLYRRFSRTLRSGGALA